MGKFKKPRSFKNINMAAFPVYYRAQITSAWMDCKLFKAWVFEEFSNSQMKC